MEAISCTEAQRTYVRLFSPSVCTSLQRPRIRRIGTLQKCYHFLEIVDRLLLGLKHLVLRLLHSSLFLEFSGYSPRVPAIQAKTYVSSYELEEWDFMMAECSSFASVPLPSKLQSIGTIVPVLIRVCQQIPSGSVDISFKFEERSISDSSEIKAVISPSTCLVWCLNQLCWKSLPGIQRQKMTFSYVIIASWLNLNLKPLTIG